MRVSRRPSKPGTWFVFSSRKSAFFLDFFVGLFISFGFSSLRYKICVDTSELSSGDGEVRGGGRSRDWLFSFFIFFLLLRVLLKDKQQGAEPSSEDDPEAKPSIQRRLRDTLMCFFAPAAT